MTFTPSEELCPGDRCKERFTALLHHVTIDLLKDAYFWLKREAAPG
jgi:RNA-directed DNA polymerase